MSLSTKCASHSVSSFPPVIDDCATTLVLGSMPGKASLRQQQYYAHPQNLFWQILLSVCGEEETFSYGRKLDLLRLHHVALWDVLKHCERPGSLDSSIVVASEHANDIPSLLNRYPSVQKICFNGKKAFHAFQKHLWKRQPDFYENYRLVVLPSTSPANASIPKHIKWQHWKNEVWSTI